MEGIEIFEHNAPGYKALLSYEGWKVAIANYKEHFDRDKYSYLERHLLTDEVFVLLSGEATLVINKDFTEIPMEPYKIYNVKRGTWHALWLNPDSKVLIVENENTGAENTEDYYFR